MEKLPSRMSHTDRLHFFSKKLDRQGFLRSRVRVARIGIQYYEDYGKVMRPINEVMRSLPTFNDQLIVLNHPSGDVDATNAHDLQIGFVSNVRYRNGWLEGIATITDSGIIGTILVGDTLEFSCGYDADIINEPGVYQGEAYDYCMRNIVGNHIALVPAARAGEGATFIDRKDIISGNVTPIKDIMTIKDTVVEPNQEVALVDSVANESTLSAENDSLKAEVANLKSQVEALTNSSKVLQDSLDTVNAQKDALDVKLNDSAEAVKIDLTGGEIAARVEAWTTVKPLLKDSVDVNYGLTVPEVRKLWLAQELPNLAAKIKSGSEAYISGLWDSVSERLAAPVQEPVTVVVPVKDSVDKDEPLISVLQAPIKDSVDTLEQARLAYIARLSCNRG